MQLRQSTTPALHLDTSLLQKLIQLSTLGCWQASQTGPSAFQGGPARLRKIQQSIPTTLQNLQIAPSTREVHLCHLKSLHRDFLSGVHRKGGVKKLLYCGEKAGDPTTIHHFNIAHPGKPVAVLACYCAAAPDHLTKYNTGYPLDQIDLLARA